MSTSFRSYYNAFGFNGQKKQQTNSPVIENVEFVNNIPDVRILPPLRHGEEIIAQAQRVHVFQPLSLNNQGLIGELYITNFRLSFQTLRFPDYRQDHQAAVHDYWHPWTPGLIDIPLLSIAQMFRLSKSGKRKPFKIGGLKRLVILCKNFRLETFSFQLSSTSDSHSVASALSGYVHPLEKERLFVYHYGAKNTNPSVGNDTSGDSVPSFSMRSDWITEMKRTDTNFASWRILQANENFHICSSLPRCFVVPFAVGEDAKLENLCALLNPAEERRPLVWTWSYGAASLCRMSGDIDDTFFRAVQQSHPQRHTPRILDVGAMCPNIREIKRSQEILRDLLLVESASALESSDDKWYHDLESSRWLQYVSRCLETCRMAVADLQKNISVILKETGDRDLNCAVSSLVQLCLDVSCRTLKGFHRLIEKEFVAFGHRFRDRLALVKTDPERESPVFLLFLDCVHQLLVQNPGCFEFTDVYLVLLWDSSLMGSFKTFSMNCQRDLQGTSSPSMPSVWNLSFKPDLKESIMDPLYTTTNATSQLVGSPSNVIVSLNSNLPCLQLWKHCFFRFVPPLAVSSAVSRKSTVMRELCHRVDGAMAEMRGLQNGELVDGFANGEVSVDGEDVSYEDLASLASGDSLKAATIVRRRSQLLRPFVPNATSQTLMTFQK
ncbi:hypothetical protein RvY_17419 [Ramazzottius varieornatus]|uniref:Myotubularin phosphatase domain-containing protein n=1 Tax=Ramazzottius varieornatus TaxID=947166 RepID=A0A1D1W222_RAMVA|nr:hypothetical protein RvY_17419 [Ramazzottius varieornatus]